MCLKYDISLDVIANLCILLEFGTILLSSVNVFMSKLSNKNKMRIEFQTLFEQRLGAKPRRKKGLTKTGCVTKTYTLLAKSSAKFDSFFSCEYLGPVTATDRSLKK